MPKNEQSLEVQENPRKCEAAFLVTLRFQEQKDSEAGQHLEELASLVKTLDIDIADSMIVPVRKVHPRYLVGSGKAEEIKRTARMHHADLIVFDDDLAPSQQRNLEKLTGMTVIDRHEVILDIFARRATTREAVLQVGLARMVYSLPRLTRAWTHLSRQRGGTRGTRGEGETQLEVDRRIVLQKIDKFRRELEKVRSHRATQRKRRQQKPVPTASIVGYTNAGKSSLLNAMAGARVKTEDKLFATLDPTTRKITFQDGLEVLVTDTVGFIRKLPHDLVEAFKSTLEETVLADVLIHVLDADNEELEEHMATTRSVLAEIEADDKTMLTVFNKIDLIGEDRKRDLMQQYPEAVFISTHSQEGIDTLMERLREYLEEQLALVHCTLPHSRHDLVAYLHRNGEVLSEDYSARQINITARVSEKVKQSLSEYLEPLEQDS